MKIEATGNIKLYVQLMTTRIPVYRSKKLNPMGRCFFIVMPDAITSTY